MTPWGARARVGSGNAHDVNGVGKVFARREEVDDEQTQLILRCSEQTGLSDGTVTGALRLLGFARLRATAVLGAHRCSAEGRRIESVSVRQLLQRVLPTASRAAVSGARCCFGL